MKSFVISVLLFSLVWFFLYLLGAFVGNEFNPLLWDRGSKIMYCLFSLVFSFSIVVIYYSEKDEF